jgi:hypothetical protein
MFFWLIAILQLIWAEFCVAAGWTLRAGVLQGVSTVHGPTPTLGVIVEDPGDPLVAYSLFEVFFEVDGTPFGTLHNDIPFSICEFIGEVPPGAGKDYSADACGLIPPTGLPLYDNADVLRGYVTELTTGGWGHHLIPEPSTASLLALGLVGMATARRRRTAA